MALHDAVERRLEAHDQRYTPMRRRLVEALAASGRPLTVGAIGAAWYVAGRIVQSKSPAA